jgi:hypothetical protein
MTYEEIVQRAEDVFNFLEEEINTFGELHNPSWVDAYKASFGLKGRSIAQFIRAFRETGLYFDINEVEGAYYEILSISNYCNEGLSLVERNLLRELLNKVSPP